MSRTLFIPGVIAALCAASIGRAQTSPNDMKAMMAAMESAQKAANHPGDAAMSCEVLEKELVATMNGPAVQGFAVKSGAAAQKDYDALQKGNGTMAAQMAMTMASAFVPGAASAQLAAAQAQAPAQAAQAAQRVQQRAVQMNDLVAILPQLMRGQRVIELAATKQCPWMAGAVPPGVNPFAAQPVR
jgi:hypothetical protein